MRQRVEAAGSDRDLKRGYGGIVDIEFLVQMFRLKYGKDFAEVRQPNTWNTLAALHRTQLLTVEEYATLRACYDFLCLVENRLRSFHNRSLDELPDRRDDLEKLARRVGCESALGKTAAQRFLEELDRHTTQTRRLFLELFEREKERQGPYID